MLPWLLQWIFLLCTNPSGFRQSSCLQFLLPVLVCCLHFQLWHPLCFRCWFLCLRTVAWSCWPWSCPSHALQTQPLAAGLPRKKSGVSNWKKVTNFSCSQITMGSSSKHPDCLLYLLMMYWQLLLSKCWGFLACSGSGFMIQCVVGRWGNFQ